MNWKACLSRRTAEMRRSAVRELLKLATRPEVISFAGGLPAPELFPVEEVRAATVEVLRERPAAALQYGETEGVAELRDWVAARYSSPGRPLDRRHVLITSGGQQALDLLGRVLLDEGDVVLVENPTYLALLGAWRPLGVHFSACPASGEPPEPDEPNEGLCPKVAYLIPNFQNPTGRTLSRVHREQWVAWLHRRGVACIEDDPYGELRYSGEALPSLFELEAGADREARAGIADAWHVAQTGTFSKVLAPGLRVGWVVGPIELIDPLVRAKQSMDLHTSTLTQHVVLELIRRGVLGHQRDRLRTAYRERRDAMLGALAAHFPREAAWTVPEGGMFIFVTLPEGFDATELLGRALSRGVAFVPGADFHLGELGRNTLRLCFSNSSPDRIAAGIRCLGDVVRR